MENRTTTHQNIRSLLQGLSVFVISAVFFGFLIFNIYLAWFGFWDFNFIKVQYVSACVAFLTFVLLPGALFYIFFQARKILEKYRITDKKFWKSALIIPLEVVIFAGICYINYTLFIVPLEISTIVISPHGYLVALSIVWTILIFGLVVIVIKLYNEMNSFG